MTPTGRPERLDTDFDTTGDGRDDEDAAAGRAPRCGHPDLVVHRLGLAPPARRGREDDLVAALSELVGFDPGTGVYCLAPATPPDGVLARAAQRIARVYGLPLLRYRCLELSLVDPMIDEAGYDPPSSPSPRHAARG